MTIRYSPPDCVGVAERTRYLLCRGSLVDACEGRITLFGTETAARQALMRIHQDRSGRAGWAQVVAIEPEGHLTVLTWFGRPTAPLVPEVAHCSPTRSEATGVQPQYWDPPSADEVAPSSGDAMTADVGNGKFRSS